VTTVIEQLAGQLAQELQRIERVEPIPGTTTESLSLGHALRQAIKSFESLRKDAGVTWDVGEVCDLAQEIIISGSESVIRRILSEVVYNAIRHVPGCRLEFTIEGDDVSKSPCYAHVYVRQSGGRDVDADAVSKIQAALEPSATTVSPQSGQGLRTAQIQCKSLGGWIECRRELQSENGGLIWGIHLKMAEAQEGTREGDQT
jgi:signal transduction histidine kinase